MSSASSSDGKKPRHPRRRTRTRSGELFRSGPPSPTPEERKQLEGSFVLDNVALSFRANAEPHRTAPSMNIGIPQYNPQNDVHAKSYFKTKGVAKTLQTSQQDRGGSSMVGEVFDNYVAGSHSLYEIAARNEQGAGYDYQESVCGHNIPVAPAFDGYNGPNGYRRNTFHLRNKPSSFGFQGRPQHPKGTMDRTDDLYSAPARPETAASDVSKEDSATDC